MRDGVFFIARCAVVGLRGGFITRTEWLGWDLDLIGDYSRYPYDEFFGETGND